MMNNEDFERKMDFIVNQQALFAVDIDKLRQAQDELVAAQAKTEETVTYLAAAQMKTEEAVTYLAATQMKTEEVVTRLAYVTNEGFKDVNAKIDALVNSQVENEDWRRHMEQTFDAKMNALIDSQTSWRRHSEQTFDAKMNALIDSQTSWRRHMEQTFDVKMNALIDSQTKLSDSHNQTEDALRKLSATVDRYIRHRRNGD